jgi:Uma2 family endonuclease
MAGVITAPTTTVTDRVWTVSDLERMPPGFKYEILDGVLYMAALPRWPHPAVVDNLYGILRGWVLPRRLGRVLPPQSGLHRDETNYLDPDLLFVRREQYPGTDGLIRQAALAVEVLSPSNLRAPRNVREAFLAERGVPELWYVDPKARTLEIRRLTENRYEPVVLLQGDDLVSTPELPGLEFLLSALWEDLSPD